MGKHYAYRATAASYTPPQTIHGKKTHVLVKKLQKILQKPCVPLAVMKCSVLLAATDLFSLVIENHAARTPKPANTVKALT